MGATTENTNNGGPAEDVQITLTEKGFLGLIWSDYRFSQATRPEPIWRLILLYLPRLLLNPSLQLAFLVRVAQRGPTILHHPVRWLQLVLFSSEFWHFRGPERIQLGEGIAFPHPVGVMVGPHSVIGSHVTLYNNLMIGSDRGGMSWEVDPNRCSKIGDRVSIFPYSNILGPFTVGHDAVVALGVTLGDDVPPGALKTKRTLKLAGEWDDSHVTGAKAARELEKSAR